MTVMFTDEELKIAAEKFSIIQLHNLNEATEPVHVFSDEFNQRMSSALRIEKRISHWQENLRKVAVFFLVLSIGFGSLMVFSEEARAAVYEWFKTVKENHIEYWFDLKETEKALPHVELGYIPEGYVEADRIVDEEVGYMKVSLNNRKTQAYIYVDISKFGKIDEITIDRTEEPQVVMINGIEGDFYEDTEGIMNNLIWIDNENKLIFEIDSNLDLEEMIEIANRMAIR